MSKKFKWHKAKPVKDKPPPNQEDSEGQEKATDTHAHIEGGVEIEFGQNLKKQHKAEHDQTTTHNKWQLGATVITAGLVFIYTLVMGYQTYLTREQFREQQRPYLWPVSADWQMPPNTSGKQNTYVHLRPDRTVEVISVYQNYGSSPAIIVRWTGDTEIGPDALKKLHANRWKEEQSVMPPGRSDTVPTPYTPITALGGELAGYTRIQYRDTTGHLFESDWCFFTEDFSQPMGFKYCPPELNRTRLIACEKETCEVGKSLLGQPK